MIDNLLKDKFDGIYFKFNIQTLNTVKISREGKCNKCEIEIKSIENEFKLIEEENIQT